MDPSFDQSCQENISYFYLFSGSSVVGLIAILFSGQRNKPNGPETQHVKKDEAFEVARMRYARGEITIEEFETIRKQLQEE